MTQEDIHEISLRDEDYKVRDFQAPDVGWRSVKNDAVEIPPFLNALEPLKSQLVLEVGAGDSRLTILMAQRGARILAVDFSLNALLRIGEALPSASHPRRFDKTYRKTAT